MPAGALARSVAYVDADLALKDLTELRRLAEAVRSSSSPAPPHAPAMPPYAVLRLAGRQHALLPLAQVDGPVAAWPWREHPGTHALRAVGSRAVGSRAVDSGSADGMAGGPVELDGSTATDLNAAVLADVAALAPLLPVSRGGLASLRHRLARLYGPEAVGGRPSASAMEVLVRCLHRGVNAIVWLGTGAPAGAPWAFVHDSGRPTWDAATLGTARRRYLPLVAAQVGNELRALGVALDPP